VSHHVKQREFDALWGAKAVRFSDGQFRFAIESFDNAGGNRAPGVKPIEDQVPMTRERPPQPHLTAVLASRVDVFHPVSKEAIHVTANRASKIPSMAVTTGAACDIGPERGPILQRVSVARFHYWRRKCSRPSPKQSAPLTVPAFSPVRTAEPPGRDDPLRSRRGDGDPGRVTVHGSWAKTGVS